MQRRIVMPAALFVAFTIPGGLARAQDPRRVAADHVERGNGQLAEGNFAEALREYEAAQKELPDAPEAAYNRGIALYKLGHYQEAEAAFQDALAAGNAELEARAKFNLGRAAHASGIERFQQQDIPEAANQIGRAIGFYNDALQLMPEDADAKENKAAAERMQIYLRKLMEQIQQQQQQDQQQQPTSQPDEPPTTQPQGQPASQPTSQPQEQQEQQPAQDDQQGDPNQNEQENEGESQPDQQNQPPSGGESDERQDGRENAEGARGGGDENDQRKLSPEEAERLLQEARDLERARREAKRERMLRSRGRIPVDKDW